MAYPKPLSEKTITRLYAESGLTQEQQDFLHTFFLAAANLYGAVPLAHLWSIYKELSKKTDTIAVHKKDLVAFSSIARRESQPYYVFEQDELYEADKNNPSKPIEREVVAREIMGIGYGWRQPFYRLTDVQGDKPYYVPDDFLSYAEEKPSSEETKLKFFLGNLTSDATEPADPYGHKKKSEHVGKRLSEFDFLSSDEEFEAKYIGGGLKDGPKGNKRKLAEYLEDRKGPESEKIFRDIRRRCMFGGAAPGDEIKAVTDELTECGVLLTRKILEDLVELLNNYNNHTHLYCNRGWTPDELTKQTLGKNGMPTAIKLGPGVQKAIAEGKIDRAELEEKFKAMGIKIVE